MTVKNVKRWLMLKNISVVERCLVTMRGQAMYAKRNVE